MSTRLCSLDTARFAEGGGYGYYILCEEPEHAGWTCPTERVLIRPEGFVGPLLAEVRHGPDD